MRTVSTLALALLSLCTLSCRHHKCDDPQPAQCYSGVVVGDACLDGVLIEVDAATPIGKPAGSYGNNVIAAVNVTDFASMNQVGQRVYFQYRNDPNQQYPSRVCTANTVRLQVPHFVLNNLSASACAPGSAMAR